MGSLLFCSMLCLTRLLAPAPAAGQSAPAAIAAISPATGSHAHGPADIPAAPLQGLSETAATDGNAKAQPAEEPQKNEPTPRIESWGEFEPGVGFLIGRGKAGELSVSLLGMFRYINQLPPEQSFTDHLGNEHAIDTRNDIFGHRFMIFLKGWLATPKLVYNIVLWTVSTTDQQAIFGVLGYQFSQKFSLYVGLNGLPGTRSIQGSHPFWLAPDRVLADEYFRPYFTNGVWAQGEVLPGLWYNVMLGNNSSSLGIKAADLDRKFSYGGSIWWTPTTHEFGPRGGYGDWEWHDRLATRFGVGFTQSPENRQTSATTGPSNNTTIRLADSLNVFDTGSLAPGVTVQSTDYRVISVDAGVKYRGFFLHAELYDRSLDSFVADGPLPVTKIHDWGFHIQGAFFPIKQKLELYVATSQIFGDEDAGFESPNEYLAGANYYPFRTHNHRINLQVINVNRSPVSSTFGYYVGGQKGTTVSLAASIFF